MRRVRLNVLRQTLLVSLVANWSVLVSAQPAPVPFSDCTSSGTRSSSNYDPNERINVSSVYGQIAYPDGQKTLRLTVLANTGESVIPSETDADGNLILCKYLIQAIMLLSIMSTHEMILRLLTPNRHGVLTGLSF